VSRLATIALAIESSGFPHSLRTFFQPTRILSHATMVAQDGFCERQGGKRKTETVLGTAFSESSTKIASFV
jgi:hypothetical protein